MITALQIALLLILIALIGVIIGFLFGKLSCKKQSESNIYQKNSYCENEYIVSNGLLNRDVDDDLKVLKEDKKEDSGFEKSDYIPLNDTAVQAENGLQEESNEKEENKDEGKKPLTLSGPKNGKPDNLCRIKGIGFKIEEKLHSLGIYHFEQIAAWTEEEIKWLDAHLAFSGRIIREDWIGQAKKLAAGEETEFSKKVAQGKVSTSRKD